ncbi:MAG TPA: SCO family protein [Pseudolabrys sp.]|nr:SCO family protein [Pseudolabrys sp.]
MIGRLALGSFVAGAAVAVLIAAVWPKEPPQRSAEELMNVLMWQREPVGGPFALIDHEGRRRTDVDFRGKVMVIYFGFTYCTDVCPTDLQSIGNALDRLGPLADKVQPLFISVDPETDTPEQLRKFVGLFHPRIVGLTGSATQIRRVANDFKVYYAKNEPTRKLDAAVDHSGYTFLVGADGTYIGFLPPGTSGERMASFIRPHVASGKAS